MILGEAKDRALNCLSPLGRVFRAPGASLRIIQMEPHANEGNLFNVEQLMNYLVNIHWIGFICAVWILRLRLS